MVSDGELFKVCKLCEAAFIHRGVRRADVTSAIGGN